MGKTGHHFTPYPAPDADIDGDTELYKTVLASMSPYQAVVIALPDPLHYPVIMDALNARQHILCVKPLVLSFPRIALLKRRKDHGRIFIDAR